MVLEKVKSMDGVQDTIWSEIVEGEEEKDRYLLE